MIVLTSPIFWLGVAAGGFATAILSAMVTLSIMTPPAWTRYINWPGALLGGAIVMLSVVLLLLAVVI